MAPRMMRKKVLAMFVFILLTFMPCIIGSVNSTVLKQVFSSTMTAFSRPDANTASFSDPVKTTLLDQLSDFVHSARWSEVAYGWLTRSVPELAASLWVVVGPMVQINVQLLGHVVDGTVTTVATMLSLMFEAVVFLTVLSSLLLSRHDESRLFAQLTALAFANTPQKTDFEDDVFAVVRSVMRFTFKMPALHALFTWFSYGLCDVSGGLGASIWAVAAMLVALTAFVPIWVMAIPGALELFIRFWCLLVFLDLAHQLLQRKSTFGCRFSPHACNRVQRN